MKRHVVVLAAMSMALFLPLGATEPIQLLLPNQVISKPSYPVAGDAGYVLLEIWPRVRDITLTAYFFDLVDERSRNFCETVRSALDRDAKTRASGQQTKLTSYRFCMTIKDAVREGWIEVKE